MFLSTYHRAQLLLLCGLIVSLLVFTFISRQFHVPEFPGFDGSLLMQTSPLVAVLVVAVALLVCVLLSTLIAGRIRFDAGLFCGAIGMMALSGRSGRMGDLLRQSNGTYGLALFIRLAVELVVLYAVVAFSWSALWALHKNGYLKADEFRDGVEDTDEPLWIKMMAMLMQIGVMALLILLLGQTDQKAQVMAAVGIASFLGAVTAYYMYPISPSPWLWCGPLVVGVAGYLLAFYTLGTDELWRTGQMNSSLAPLARPLPIDYATAGPAGAILGYWMSRRWHRERLEETAANTQTKEEVLDAFGAAPTDGDVPGMDGPK